MFDFGQPSTQDTTDWHADLVPEGVHLHNLHTRVVGLDDIHVP